MTTWRNWSGLEEATPEQVETPTSLDEVFYVVRRARAGGTTAKMTGTGHSFTAIAAPEHTLLRPEGLTGVLAVDREAMTVTARAGTPLKDLNLALERLGLSLHNMGYIAEQTLAGATSTGTHGTGGTTAGLGAQLAGLELVTGTGEVVRASAEENPDVFEMARVGLGALGILTSLTFHVEPLFVVEAHEQPMAWADALESYSTTWSRRPTTSTCTGSPTPTGWWSSRTSGPTSTPASRSRPPARGLRGGRTTSSRTPSSALCAVSGRVPPD